MCQAGEQGRNRGLVTTMSVEGQLPIVPQAYSKRVSASRKQDVLCIALILALAILMYFLFQFPGFASSDQVLYAIGFKDSHGQEPFNEEMSFGYYRALHPLVSRLSPQQVPVVMNRLSSAFGTMLLVPLFVLFRRPRSW